MSRRDYELIASAFRAAKHAFADTPKAATTELQRSYTLAGIDYAAYYIAKALAKDNPRFNEDRFIKATQEAQ